MPDFLPPSLVFYALRGRKFDRGAAKFFVQFESDFYNPLDTPLELTLNKTVECTWIICFNLICPVHHDAEVSEMIALTGNILPVHTYPLIRYRIIIKSRYTVHI